MLADTLPPLVREQPPDIPDRAAPRILEGLSVIANAAAVIRLVAGAEAPAVGPYLQMIERQVAAIREVADALAPRADVSSRPGDADGSGAVARAP